ncbi:hypothetical protein SCHPADRAFT_947298 [Schizopora paradoxa]|uniref:Uncharacterized protein n=1 Tax=Schizopora paradoxa TaxID=27342 RepID=A0A0H2QZZ1_9AGAM|nr:hypothetical protein SCHPADRAFT_947298 [Schizopora paradoxa]
MHDYIPLRVSDIPTPLFREKSERFKHEIATLLPAFLNSRRLRVNWSEDVSRYGDDEFGTQKNTFVVTVPFPEEYAGRCTGKIVPLPADDDTDSPPAGGRTLSAVIASLPSTQAQAQAKAARKEKTMRAIQAALDEDEPRVKPDHKRLETLLVLAREASQRAAEEVFSCELSSQGISLDDLPVSRAGTPSTSRILHIGEDDYDDSQVSGVDAGYWFHDPPFGSPSKSVREGKERELSPEMEKTVVKKFIRR